MGEYLTKIWETITGKTPENKEASEKNKAKKEAEKKSLKGLSKLEQKQIQEQVEAKAQTQAIKQATELENYFTDVLNDAGFFEFRLQVLKNHPKASEAIDKFFADLHEQIDGFQTVASQEKATKKILDRVAKMSPTTSKANQQSNSQQLKSIMEKKFPDFWPKYNTLRTSFNKVVITV